MQDSLYFDFAAATPVDPLVLTAMKPYFTELFYNPSATYLAARNVSVAIGQARSDIAHWLGARPAELIFTAGGTEANNAAIHGIMSQYPGANLVISAVEHDAIRMPARSYAHTNAVVDQNGIVIISELEKSITGTTVLVSIMYANNEIGTIQPLKQVAELIRSIRKQRAATGNDLPLYFHTDACQAANYLDLHITQLGVDLMTLNAGKMYGPKQVGLLYCRPGISLNPLIQGGGQEYNLRSGTENVPGVVGFAAALTLAQERRKGEQERLRTLQRDFIAKTEKILPSVVVNGSMKHRLPNNVHCTFPGFDNERLVMLLDEMGIQCAVGSACSASKDEPSHVLEAIGVSTELAQSSIRFSFGRSTTQASIDTLVAALDKILS